MSNVVKREYEIIPTCLTCKRYSGTKCELTGESVDMNNSCNSYLCRYGTTKVVCYIDESRPYDGWLYPHTIIPPFGGIGLL